jgi:hypothetical protein
MSLVKKKKNPKQNNKYAIGAGSQKITSLDFTLNGCKLTGK